MTSDLLLRGLPPRHLDNNDDEESEPTYFVWSETCNPVSGASSSFSCSSYLRPANANYHDDVIGNDDYFQQLRSSTDTRSGTCTFLDDDNGFMTCYVFSNLFGYYYATCSVAALLQQGLSAQQACTCNNATLYKHSQRDVCQQAPCNGDNDDEDCPVCEWIEQCGACQFGENDDYNGIPVEALASFFSSNNNNNDDNYGSVDVTDLVDNSQPSIMYQDLGWQMKFTHCTSEYSEGMQLSSSTVGMVLLGLLVLVAVLMIAYYIVQRQRRKGLKNGLFSTPLSSSEGVLS